MSAGLLYFLFSFMYIPVFLVCDLFSRSFSNKSYPSLFPSPLHLLVEWCHETWRGSRDWDKKLLFLQALKDIYCIFPSLTLCRVFLVNDQSNQSQLPSPQISSVWMPFSFATHGTLTHPSSPRSNAASSVKPSLIHPLESGGVPLCLSQCSDHTVIAILLSRAYLWSFDQLVSFTSLLEHRAGQLLSAAKAWLRIWHAQ